MNTQAMDTQFQDRCDKLVDREVIVCLSSLVDGLIRQGSAEFIDDYPDLVGGYVENDKGEEEYESPRVDRRLIFLRGLANEQTTWILTRSA